MSAGVDSYEVDVSELGPGPHLFILSVDDGYGKSLMKVYPFTLGTGAQRIPMAYETITLSIHTHLPSTYLHV